jgi:hypothetical protein
MVFNSLFNILKIKRWAVVINDIHKEASEKLNSKKGNEWIKKFW